MSLRRSLRIGLSIGLLVSTSAICDEDASTWKLISKGSDYTLYERPSEGVAGLVAFRLVGELAHSPEVTAIGILDRDHRMAWMRDVRELRTVRVPKPGEVIEYTAVKTPFILKDRDFVIRTEVKADLRDERYVIESHSVLDDEFPPHRDVRGALVKGVFVVEKGSVPGKSKLTADMDVDPKGSVPRWIVNAFQKSWPVGMFRGLQYFLATNTATLPADLAPLFRKDKK